MTESTVPTLTTAVATGTTLTLTFSENMNEDAKPSSSVFAVDVANTDDDPSVYDYTIEDDKIVLKLATAVKAGAELTVTYNKPTGAKDTVLEDVGGNDLAQITDRAVTNSTVDLIVVNKTSLTINERGSGNTGTFTVKLGSQPAGDVTVAVTIKGDDPPGRMDDNILDFDEDTWSTAQTVTVTGQYDANDWNDTATIHLTASQGRLKEERLGSATVALTVTDTASQNGVEITPESYTIDEGSSAKMSVRLTKLPAGECFRAHRPQRGPMTGFRSGRRNWCSRPRNYNTLQDFTLHAEEDADTDDEDFARESARQRRRLRLRKPVAERADRRHGQWQHHCGGPGRALERAGGRQRHGHGDTLECAHRRRDGERDARHRADERAERSVRRA